MVRRTEVEGWREHVHMLATVFLVLLKAKLLSWKQKLHKSAQDTRTPQLS